jgi:hypothetical protein
MITESENNNKEAINNNEAIQTLKTKQQHITTLLSNKRNIPQNMNDRVILNTELKQISKLLYQLSKPHIITKESQKIISTPIKDESKNIDESKIEEADLLKRQIQKIESSLLKASDDKKKQLLVKLNAKKGLLSFLINPPIGPPPIKQIPTIKNVKFDDVINSDELKFDDVLKLINYRGEEKEKKSSLKICPSISKSFKVKVGTPCPYYSYN